MPGEIEWGARRRSDVLGNEVMPARTTRRWLDGTDTDLVPVLIVFVVVCEFEVVVVLVLGLVVVLGFGFVVVLGFALGFGLVVGSARRGVCVHSRRRRRRHHHHHHHDHDHDYRRRRDAAAAAAVLVLLVVAKCESDRTPGALCKSAIFSLVSRRVMRCSTSHSRSSSTDGRRAIATTVATPRQRKGMIGD